MLAFSMRTLEFWSNHILFKFSGVLPIDQHHCKGASVSQKAKVQLFSILSLSSLTDPLAWLQTVVKVKKKLFSLIGGLERWDNQT